MIVLGVGDLGASATAGEVIRTYALGSCVAVILIDPRGRAGGMLHLALPESHINPAKAQSCPGYFADTGIPALLRQMERLGCPPRSLIVKLAGGAKIMDPNDTFSIGKRNVLATKKLLWTHGLGAVAEDVGENFSRTVNLQIGSGEVTLSSPGRPNWTL